MRNTMDCWTKAIGELILVAWLPPYNLASARHSRMKPCLVLKSTLVYVEVPMWLLHTMTALAAMGTHPISAYQPKIPLMISENIEVLEGWSGFNSNTSPSIYTSCSTLSNVRHCIENPMAAANVCSNHHDQHPVDLAAICSKIECTTTQWKLSLLPLLLFWKEPWSTAPTQLTADNNQQWWQQWQ